MKNILEIKRAERQEIEKIREERRYNEEREYRIRIAEEFDKSKHIAFNQIFIFSVSIGTLAVLTLYYIAEPINKIHLCCAIFPLIAFTILVYSMLQFLDSYLETSKLPITPIDEGSQEYRDFVEANKKIGDKEVKAYAWFKDAIWFLLIGVGMIVFYKILLAILKI